MIKTIHIKLLLLFSLSILFGHSALGQTDIENDVPIEQHVCADTTITYTLFGFPGSTIEWYVDGTHLSTKDFVVPNNTVDPPADGGNVVFEGATYNQAILNHIWTLSGVNTLEDHTLKIQEVSADAAACSTGVLNPGLLVHVHAKPSISVSASSIAACSGGSATITATMTPAVSSFPDVVKYQYRLRQGTDIIRAYQFSNQFLDVPVSPSDYNVDSRYVVVDGSDNVLYVVRGSFNSSALSVVEDADTTNPVFADNLNNLTIDADPNKCSAIVTYNNPVVTDNCAFVEDMTDYTFIGKFNGHSYYLSDTPLNATNANKAAFNVGGHLVTIEDDLENDFLRDNSILKANVSEGIWIGLNDSLIQSDFKWVTGGTSSYYNWNGSQPSDNSGAEDWVELYVNWGGDKIGNHPENGKWNDNSISQTKKYVVEFEGPRFTQTLGLISGSAFPIGTTTNTFEIINSVGSGTGIFKSFVVIVTKENNLALVDVTGTTTPETDAGIVNGIHCPDLNDLQAVIAPISNPDNKYDPGTSQVQFRVDRLCVTGDWSFRYEVNGATVVTGGIKLDTDSGSATDNSGVISVTAAATYVLFTIDVDNVVGTALPIPIDFTISNGGTNNAIQDAITIRHKLKIIPQIVGFE
ncbi:C-type lectin domain-containing protein [Ancylomarina sp. YFZ004]